MYATLSDVRAEGVTEAQASDERLIALLEEAGQVIDRTTGWFFEPRQRTYVLDGRGTPSLEPPVPPIRLDRLTAHGRELSRRPADLIVIGAPIVPGFFAPRLARTQGVFVRGQGNIEASGQWGYTEDDGSESGRTPLPIRRVCLLLVLRWLPVLADSDGGSEARDRWRVLEERTRDQSYKLDRVLDPGPFTGDPEIDRILLRFRRPPGMGAT
ncbi:MAG: hypothetical protein MJE77_17010 [Proteobacteria bacterium]|nr:hypothetical protein [Pseudomonadota bacterium]